MVTMEDEWVAAANLVANAHEKLKGKYPTHELLKYVDIKPHEVVIVSKHANEFYKKFPPTHPENKETEHEIYNFLKYEKAMSDACLE